MKKIVFIVEKTNTGYSAYAQSDKYPITTVGATLDELRANMLESANTYFKFMRMPKIKAENISVKIDLPQFFEYFKEINSKNLSIRIGMNATLLSQYINGKKTPSEKQVSKILQGVRQLGRELSSIDLA